MKRFAVWAFYGIGAAVISYRLTPTVQHPGHIKDVARAFVWLHENIKKYGGRPDELFVCGHSAGGHLVALLATDESYLKAEGLALSDIKGVMPISGVYVIPDNFFNAVFGKEPSYVAALCTIEDPAGADAGTQPVPVLDTTRLTGAGLPRPPFTPFRFSPASSSDAARPLSHS